MNALRRALYLQAATWALLGLGLSVAPGLIVETFFAQPPMADDTWARLFGLHAFGLGMLMVLVAHRVEELWWWSWAFALVTASTAAVVVLHTALGLAPAQSPALWWIASFVSLGFALALLYGLYVSSRERPIL